METNILWVHSGGTNPVTGEPSPASRARLERAIGLAYAERDVVLMVTSGEETRKSGPGAQGLKLATWVERTQPDMPVSVVANDGNMMETFKDLRDHRQPGQGLIFVNDDVHMDRYMAQFMLANHNQTRIVPEEVPVMQTVYLNTYTPDYIACYNALAWMRLAGAGQQAAALAGTALGTYDPRTLKHPSREWPGLPSTYRVVGTETAEKLQAIIKANATIWMRDALRRVGAGQLALFAVDRKLDKPQHGLKARVAALAEGALREDLRGREE